MDDRRSCGRGFWEGEKDVDRLELEGKRVISDELGFRVVLPLILRGIVPFVHVLIPAGTMSPRHRISGPGVLLSPNSMQPLCTAANVLELALGPRFGCRKSPPRMEDG